MDYDLLQKIYNIKSFVGYTDEEIKELRAGFESIPHTLYEIWKKCGKTSELFNYSNDPWVTLDFQRRYKWTRKTKGYFYILNENQGVYQVAIRRADMAEDDPPVYVVETDDDGTVNEIGQAENSLSAFMMGMLIYEAAISCFEFCAEDFITGILTESIYTRKLMKKSCLLCREILRMAHIQHGQKRHIRRLTD